jgi:hypothetical protein
VDGELVGTSVGLQLGADAPSARQHVSSQTDRTASVEHWFASRRAWQSSTAIRSVRS